MVSLDKSYKSLRAGLSIYVAIIMSPIFIYFLICITWIIPIDTWNNMDAENNFVDNNIFVLASI